MYYSNYISNILKAMAIFGNWSRKDRRIHKMIIGPFRKSTIRSVDFTAGRAIQCIYQCDVIVLSILQTDSWVVIFMLF